MTRKDYQVVAETLNAAYEEIGTCLLNVKEKKAREHGVMRAASLLAVAFKTENPRFSPEQFFRVVNGQ